VFLCLTVYYYYHYYYYYYYYYYTTKFTTPREHPESNYDY